MSEILINYRPLKPLFCLFCCNNAASLFIMQKIITCILLLFVANICNAQIRVNNTIDPSDKELNQAVQFLSSYIEEFSANPGAYPDFTKYWPAEDCERYKHPDQLMNAINSEIPTYLLGRPTILSVKPELGLFHIKTLFGHVDSVGNILVLSITNHYVQRNVDGSMHFVNPMKVNESNWRNTTIGNITYHYPATHDFDKKKAKELIARIRALEEEWQLIPIFIQYYFADTKEEIEHYRGFDFTIAMGNRDKPSGISDGIDNIIYCGGLGENYFHEVVHIYLNRLFPKSPLNEGLAVFYGGSLGHELSWHVQRLNQYLQQHKEIDLNDLNDFYYLDNFTNPCSTIQGLLCMIAHDNGGLQNLKRTMRYTSLNELLLKEYGVEKGGWNAFLRKKIAEYAAKKP